MIIGAAVPLAAAAGAVSITAADGDPNHITLTCRFGAFTRQTVRIDDRPFIKFSLAGESVKQEPGAPALPGVSRSVIIPGDAKMAVRVVDSTCYEIANIDIAPSRGFISRNADPDTVPYAFGPVYEADAFYPGSLAALGEPYILRDHRGIVVTVNPFQYNPVRRVLRVYTAMTVEIAAVGRDRVNVLEPCPRVLSRAFHQLYEAHFVNYNMNGRYAPLDEEGGMLIICHDAWIENVMPLLDHKNSIGIPTSIVGVSEIGNDHEFIKMYIQNVYDTTDLAFVLLVGDVDEVGTPYSAYGAADPVYAKLAGDDDYPDIMVGRFSAASTLHVETQVQRTIGYENMLATEQDWYRRGAGVSSDGDYMDTIRQKLLDHDFTEVDQIYDPEATAEMVIEALNAGRGVVNYYGHGSSSMWGTSNFTINHIDQLANQDMLPWIFNVACCVGAFDNVECMGEAWLRAQHGGEPTGAIACYAASGVQYCEGPTSAQHEAIDLFVDETYHSFGTICFAGACRMIDEYGPEGALMFDTWIVFGDPSVRIVGSVEHSCPGDFDDDGDIDTADLLFLLGAWGTSAGDVDDDGDTDTADLLALLGAWGECP
jgi:hypothetical protein